MDGNFCQGPTTIQQESFFFLSLSLQIGDGIKNVSHKFRAGRWGQREDDGRKKSF